MKLIFLDIDGVLNSHKFLENLPEDSFGIDNSRLPILKRITVSTDAKIVLSSSWRKNWDIESEKRTALGNSLVELFAKFGLEIFDKTPEIDYYRRNDEIKSILKKYDDIVESYVILDDMKLGWEDLSDTVVNTNDRIGRGLEEEHADKAIEILNL